MTSNTARANLDARLAGPLTSWSLLLSLWTELTQAPDPFESNSIPESFESLKRGVVELEQRLGGFTTDKLLILTFLSRLQQYRDDVVAVMDAQLAIDPSITITSADVLNLATRFHQAATAQSSSGTGHPSAGAKSQNAFP
ncbi:hypothetical protein PTTG_04939 [Puccinia triticina 1-1 BBBD Race 1]|uniref:Uncharacterized protein n=1 Tax=Puccinia triticina (isolate 1-1 / race 1 (BBBD)) TaxID=630390 RepID=A0A0C4EVV3_PUCT1|nr:hypothetical protein PTTG_04939 [Puccinia triticina 1-1 BBBD Race 1]